MAKEKKITMQNIMAACSDKNDNKTTIKLGTPEETIEINVKTNLTLEELRDFVGNVLKMVFLVAEDGTVVYCPHMKELAFDYNVVSTFTKIEMGDDPEKVWKFLKSTDIARKIASSLPEEMLSKLCGAANEAIEYKKEQLIKRGKVDDILDNVISLLKMLNNKIEGADSAEILDYLRNNIPGFDSAITDVFDEQKEENTNIE